MFHLKAVVVVTVCSIFFGSSDLAAVLGCKALRISKVPFLQNHLQDKSLFSTLLMTKNSNEASCCSPMQNTLLLHRYKPFLMSPTIMALLVTEIQQGTGENPHIKLFLNALHQS